MSSLQLQHTKYCIFWLKQHSPISDEQFPEYYETRKAKYFSLLLFWWPRTRLLNLSKENCFGNNLKRHYTWLLDTATHRLFTFPLLHKDPCYRRAISSSIKKDEMKTLKCYKSAKEEHFQKWPHITQVHRRRPTCEQEWKCLLPRPKPNCNRTVLTLQILPLLFFEHTEYQ